MTKLLPRVNRCLRMSREQCFLAGEPVELIGYAALRKQDARKKTERFR